MAGRVDNNAGTQLRQRRSLQRLNTAIQGIAPGDGITIVEANGVLEVVANAAEAINTSTAGIGMTLLSTGGLAFTSSSLGVKLADTSLKTASAGLSANLAATGALSVSSGLKVNVDGTTVTVNGS